MRWMMMSPKMYAVGLAIGAGAWLFLIEAAAAGMHVQSQWVYGP